MQIPILRRGGSGGGLNFKVVGGTSTPSNPKENTIWVNTSVAITGWAFSADAPTAPYAGMVWFSIGINSLVPFNALKENTIQVYPVVACQYINSAWVSVTAQSYQSGSWKTWIVNPLIDGKPEASFLSAGVTLITNSTTSASSYTFTSTAFQMAVDGSGTYTIQTNKSFDMTGIRKIRIDGVTQRANSSGAGTSTTSAPLTMSLVQNGGIVVSATYYPSSIASYSPDESFSKTLDLSAIDVAQKCYLRFSMTRNGNYRSFTYFNNIIFE